MKAALLTAAFFIPLVFPYEFPDNFPRCHLSSSDLDSCLKIGIEKAFKLIGTKGIPTLNLPPIEPIETSSLEIGAGSSAVKLVQKYKDIKLYGYMNAKVENAHFDPDARELTFTTFLPKLEQKAKYEVNGQILVLPLYGAGDSTMTLYDLRVVHKLKFKEKSQDGKTYFKVKSYKITMTPGGAKFELENLFDGDKLLAESTLKVMNENWDVLYNDVKGELEETYAPVFKGIADKLFDNVPAEDIFLE